MSYTGAACGSACTTVINNAPPCAPPRDISAQLKSAPSSCLAASVPLATPEGHDDADETRIKSQILKCLVDPTFRDYVAVVERAWKAVESSLAVEIAAVEQGVLGEML